MIQENKQREQAALLAETARAALEDKKGLDVEILHVGSQTIVADYFVVATGSSNTHVRALADEVEFKIGEALGIEPRHIEGAGNDTWTLLDYGSVVVHVFTKEGRAFYKLERLWSEAAPAQAEEPGEGQAED